MNSRNGLKYVFDHREAFQLVAESIDPRFPLAMTVIIMIVLFYDRLSIRFLTHLTGLKLKASIINTGGT